MMMVIKNVNIHIKYYFTFVVILILGISAQAQTNNKSVYSAKLLVLDKNTQQPIPYANVCYEQLEDGTKYYRTTTQEGIVENPLQQTAFIAISYVGYKTIMDTVQSGESKTYQMEQDIFNMEQVVITGTRTEKMLAKSPVLTKVITGEELSASGAVTALDALEYSLPGVQFTPDAHGDNLQIQGLDNDYILVLVNGERMIGETRGNVNFDRLSAENIKRIEIVNGASSVLYGSNAIGAVINIITDDDTYIKPFSTTINSRYSAYNELLLSANVKYSKKKFSLSLNGFRSSTDGYDLTPATPASYTVNKHVDYSGKIRLAYKLNKKLSLSTHATYFQHELTNPEKSTKSTHDLNKDYSAGAKVIYTPNKKHSMELKTSTDIYNAYTIYEKNDDEKEKDSDYRYSSILFIDTYVPNKKLEIVGGAETNFEKVYSLDLFGEDEGENKYAHDLNIFAQADYHIFKNFEVVGGFRNTYHSNYGNHFTPKASLMYTLKDFKFRANIANGYKAPSLKELYYNFNHSGMFMIYGNSDLKPESAFYTSFSTEYTKKSFNASITAFYNCIQDKIEYKKVINENSEIPLEYRYLNIGEATIKGFETYVSVKIISNLKAKIAYVFTDAIDESTGLQLYNNSKHSGTFSLIYKKSNIKYPFSVCLNGRAASGKLQEESETETDDTGEEITTITKYQTNPYTLWKITYNQEFKITKKIKTQLQFGINNIFDYVDSEDLAIIDPGRRVFIGLKFIF